MPLLKKYPLYQYDEPATYDDFKGGINLDPTSENLADNEMRDCVNMEYSHVTLKKRRGAKRLCRLVIEKQFNLIQGIFMFTKKESFIILAADGRLYYGLFRPGIDIELMPLPISDVKEYMYDKEVVDKKNIYQFAGLSNKNYILDDEFKHDGYTLNNSELIFQNKEKIEFAAYDNKVYVATGTRIVVVEVEDDTVTLTAHCNPPRILNGEEYQIYGENFMSPYPYNCMQSGEGAAAAIKNITIQYEGENSIYDANSKLLCKRTSYICSAVMLYTHGLTDRDYYYHWRILDAKTRSNTSAKDYEWKDVIDFTESKSLFADRQNYNYNKIHLLFDELEDGVTEEEIAVIGIDNNAIRCFGSLENITLECNFAEDVTPTEETKNKPESEKIYEVDKLDGKMFGQIRIVPNVESIDTVSDTWKTLQTCKKILVDGNKFLFYDDAYNSGNWFKTFIDKPGYVSNKGCLNFKTTKNEKLAKVVHFKGVLVAFSYNKYVGGNIAIVTGNGDDDSADQSYSPYIRRVVNSEISCDSPNTVQIAENMLFFKFRDTVYAIEGSDISSEIVTLYSMNDKLRKTNPTVTIPWTEECESELTDEFYSLIWKEKIEWQNGEAYIARPAMRVKMYYKIGQKIDGKIFFPWLRDEGNIFNNDGVITIDGIATHLRNMELLQFSDEHYLDIDEHYDCTVKLKAYDLNYPKFSKFIRSTILFYHRPTYGQVILNTSLKNESDHSLFDATSTDVALQDLETIRDGITVGKVGRTLSDTKVYNPKYMFPLLQASLELKIICDTTFVLNSVTFNYYTTDLPEVDQFDSYQKIIRREPKQINIRKIEKGKDSISFLSDNLDEDDNSIQYSYDGTNQSYFVLAGKEPMIRAEEKNYMYIYAGNPMDRIGGFDDTCLKKEIE